MLRRPFLAAAAAIAGFAVRRPAAAQPATGAVALQSWGSFHVGGHDVTLTGKPIKEVLFSPGGVPAKVDQNGTYLAGAMYAQFMIPAERRGAYPLLLWHGGGLSGVCYETTPDGREGWQHYFLRRGWPVYVSDAVERGRAGWSMYPDIFPGEPVFLTVDNPWERFRIGDGPGSFKRHTTYPGSQYPTDPAAYLNFVRQCVPRFTTTDDLTIQAYGALLDRVGPSVVLVHSQAGLFGWRAAQEWPDKVKALILVEPATVGDPAKVAALKTIPQLVIYGDFIAQDSRWPAIRRNGLAFVEQVRAAGGQVDVIDLPEHGIHGNTHMMMHDKTSDAVAGVIQAWLVQKGLWQG